MLVISTQTHRVLKLSKKDGETVELGKRKEMILAAVVEHYISIFEPIGSPVFI